jgi:hypothetical protein
VDRAADIEPLPGPAASGGREYSYRVPVERSKYLVRVPGQSALLAYSGRFTLELKTADLVRLTVEVDSFPAASRVCSAASEIQYARTAMNGTPFLLPRESVLEISDANGDRARNEIRFAGCREFRADSQIHFQPGSPATGSPTVAPAAAPPSPIPMGLPVSIELPRAVDLTAAWAGDVIQGRLREALKTGRTLHVPKGARVEGRILRAARIFQPVEHFSVWIRFDRAITPAGVVPLRLTPVSWRRVRPGAAEVLLYGKDQEYLPKGFRLDWQTW